MTRGIVSARDQGAFWREEHQAMHKGAPFAGYEDFDDCTSKNSDKNSPDAYCGEIKHKVEGAYYTEDDMRNGPPEGTRPVVVSPDGSHQELSDWVRGKTSALVKSRYVLLPHWDPELAAEILHDHADDMGYQHQRLAAAKDWSQVPPEERPYHQKFQPGDSVKLEDFMPERQGEVGTVSGVPDRRYKNGLKVNVQWEDGKETQHWWNNVRHASRLAAPAPSDYPGLVDLAKQGGFTLHDHVGDGPTNGYMVSRDKNTETTVPIEQLRPKMIGDFVNKNARALSQPHNYLGGWLDGKNFYLDVSTHRPTIDRAAADAVRGSQLAIYDLDHGTSINTPDAVNDAGDPGLALPEDHHQNPFYGALAAPEHDWTQHGLGDPDDWASFRVAVLNPDGSFDLGGMADQHQQLGTHKGTTVFNNPTNGENWLVKPVPGKDHFLADLDTAASALTSKAGLDAPPTFKTKTPEGKVASAQLMYPGATDAFSSKVLGDGDIKGMSDQDLMTVQKHHALDWLLGNHDAHGGQFIRGKDGKLIGIDKAQGFKYVNNDRLGWDFHPNGPLYGESEPVYNQLYRGFAKGGRPLNDPRQGEYGKFISGLQSIPDEEYAGMFRPYAENAAKVGKLATDFAGQYDGFAKPKFAPNDVEAFLHHIVARKNSLMHDMGGLYDRARAYRMTGTKIAKQVKAFAPDPVTLKNMHQQLGSHGAQVYSDAQGKWLVKKPPPGAEFMTSLDQATHDLQNIGGLITPESHTIQWKDGSPVTAVRMLDGAHQAFDEPPGLADVHPKDRETIQKHHVLDWLIGNHDTHVGNWMRLPAENPADPANPGDLVGIDKGQSLKYFGQDRLDPEFHPNFYARPPIYNRLWQEYSHGEPGEMDDPRHGQVGRLIDRLQDIPDHDYKEMFRPYAEHAAQAGVLANHQDTDSRRKLDPPTIAPNDPESFLDAMVHRKKTLRDQLGGFYDKMAQARHWAIQKSV